MTNQRDGIRESRRIFLCTIQIIVRSRLHGVKSNWLQIRVSVCALRFGWFRQHICIYGRFHRDMARSAQAGSGPRSKGQGRLCIFVHDFRWRLWLRELVQFWVGRAAERRLGCRIASAALRRTEGMRLRVGQNFADCF